MLNLSLETRYNEKEQHKPSLHLIEERHRVLS